MMVVDSGDDDDDDAHDYDDDHGADAHSLISSWQQQMGSQPRRGPNSLNG